MPDTALLVPGVAGRATVLEAEGRAAREAVAALVASGPSRVVVVAGKGPVVLTPAGEASFAAAGVADGAPRGAVGRRVPDVATSVGLHLLAAVGWGGPTSCAGTGGADDVLRELGRRVVAEDPRTALLLVGSLSARRGPDAPLPEDARAPVVDREVLDALVSLDADADARARLADVPRALADELAVTARGAWQVLLGAASAWDDDGDLIGELLACAAPLGATYATVVWHLRS